MTLETCLAYANFWYAQTQVQALVERVNIQCHFRQLLLNLLDLVCHHWVLLVEVERQQKSSHTANISI